MFRVRPYRLGGLGFRGLRLGWGGVGRVGFEVLSSGSEVAFWAEGLNPKPFWDL